MNNVFSNVPVEMQNLHDWLLWHKFMQDGTFKKIPDEFSRNGKNWETIQLLSFVEAKTALYSPKSLSDGIGVAFTQNNNIAGIDIDDAINPDGSYNECVRKIILPVLQMAAHDNCYIERSISGTGYHIYGYTTLKSALLSATNNNGKIASANIEIYWKDCYFTVSGDACNSGWGYIDNAIRTAYRIIKNAELPEPSENTPKPSVSAVKTKDDKLPNRANHKAYNAKFAVSDDDYTDSDVLRLPALPLNTVLRIMSNDTEHNGRFAWDILQNGYPNDDTINKSEVDMKIIGTLVYWLYRYDVAEICKVIESSAIYRKNEKGKKYLTDTIIKARDNAELFFLAVNYKKLSLEEQATLKRWVASKKG